MKKFSFVLIVVIVLSMIMAACAPKVEEPVVEEPVVEEPVEEPVVEDVPFSCGEGIKVGLITDVTGALAIYGTMILRSFMLGME